MGIETVLITKWITAPQGFAEYIDRYDPALIAGKRLKENMLLVSRGLGNSIIPIRFNNRPEIILIELRG